MKKIILAIGAVLVVVVVMFVLQSKGILQLTGNSNSNNNNNIDNVSGNKAVDLSNRGLKSIPSYIFNQTNIEELNVSSNSLTGAIQSQIGQLKNLRILDASHNQMTGVPAEIGQLQNLQILDLSYNQLTGLPNELGNLKNLRTLNLAGNSYSQQDLDKIRANLPNTNFILN